MDTFIIENTIDNKLNISINIQIIVLAKYNIRKKKQIRFTYGLKSINIIKELNTEAFSHIE